MISFYKLYFLCVNVHKKNSQNVHYTTITEMKGFIMTSYVITSDKSLGPFLEKKISTTWVMWLVSCSSNDHPKFFGYTFEEAGSS